LRLAIKQPAASIRKALALCVLPLAVTRVVAAVEGGDFSFLVIVAFSPTPKSAVTYCFTPGTLSKEEALKLVADMIESLELQKSPRE
jgi:hypothetical protein